MTWWARRKKKQQDRHVFGSSGRTGVREQSGLWPKDSGYTCVVCGCLQDECEATYGS